MVKCLGQSFVSHRLVQARNRCSPHFPWKVKERNDQAISQCKLLLREKGERGDGEEVYFMNREVALEAFLEVDNTVCREPALWARRTSAYLWPSPPNYFCMTPCDPRSCIVRTYPRA